MSVTLNNPDRFANVRRIQHPGRGEAVDHGNSRATAIEEMCRECLGQIDCSDCTDRQCPLFPFRPGADKEGANQRKPGDVPTQAEYAELRRLQDPDGVKAQTFRDRVHGMAKD